MSSSSLPLGLALASALLLPLSASAVPIHAADGVAESTPGRTAGPRHPGVIAQSAGTTPLGNPTSHGRGRPVPGQVMHQTDNAMAEAPAVRVP